MNALPDDMRKEFDEILGELVHGIGEFTFAGVGPLGYKGCSYWYLDTTKKVQQTTIKSII